MEMEIGEEQQGFSKGGMMDGMFMLRQLVEKRFEGQGEMTLGFVDLEKAYDTVPRKMVMVTLRWMGVPEAEVMLVERMYERMKGRVLVVPGMSEELGEHRFETGMRSQPTHVYHGDGAGKQEIE